MNNSSSRSHCIIGFRLLQTGGKDGKDKDSQIYIVDLAGSERIAKVGVEPGSQSGAFPIAIARKPGKRPSVDGEGGSVHQPVPLPRLAF